MKGRSVRRLRIYARSERGIMAGGLPGGLAPGNGIEQRLTVGPMQ